jgi:hypothetical protein
MISSLLTFLTKRLTTLFEPVRPRSGSEDDSEAKKSAAPTERDKEECLEHLSRAWRLHVVIRQRYREMPLAEAIDSFARWALSDLVRNFPWVQRETRPAF